MTGGSPRGAGILATDLVRVFAAPGDALNLGCGDDYREGWVNLDRADTNVRADVRHDLERLPLPFRDETFAHVLASHVLEHVPARFPDSPRDALLRVMEELHRILRVGGSLEIAYPHPDRPVRELFRDPTHTRVLSRGTWSYFDPMHPYHFYTHAAFTLDRANVTRRLDRGPVNGYHLRTHLGRFGAALDSTLGRPVEERVVLRKVRT